MSQFVVWKLVDLTKATSDRPLTLFLFGAAYEAWWRELEGSVLCVLGAEPLEPSADESAYKISSAEQVCAEMHSLFFV